MVQVETGVRLYSSGTPRTAGNTRAAATEGSFAGAFRGNRALPTLIADLWLPNGDNKSLLF